MLIAFDGDSHIGTCYAYKTLTNFRALKKSHYIELIPALKTTTE